MKSPANNRKYSIGLALIGMLILCLVYCDRAYEGIPLSIRTFEQDRLLARSVFRLSNLIMVHSSEGRVLFVDGNRYTNLRGAFPFFARVPNRNAIVFVTLIRADNPTHKVIHFYDFDKKEGIEFIDDRSSFGDTLGRFNDTQDHDRVEKLDAQVLHLVSDGLLNEQVIKLDLNSRKVLSVETVTKAKGASETVRQ